MTTRRSHYVPFWYQKGFLGSQTQLQYLDVTPDETGRSTVRSVRARQLQKQSPKSDLNSRRNPLS
jgi:hypothetical protein